MRKQAKRFQLWLHHHYDGVKLFLMITTLLLLIINLFAQQSAILKQGDQIKIAINETKTTTQQLKIFTESVSDAVDELKDDNKRQTVILCTIILRGNLNLESNDEAAVRLICEQEVERALNNRVQIDPGT